MFSKFRGVIAKNYAAAPKLLVLGLEFQLNNQLTGFQIAVGGLIIERILETYQTMN